MHALGIRTYGDAIVKIRRNWSRRSGSPALLFKARRSRWHVAPAMSAPVLVLGAMVSVQIGSALATSLFERVGAGGTVFLRMLSAATMLAIVWRPSIRHRAPSEWKSVFAFGITLAGMNLAFFEAIARVPLGIAVTLEFSGPLVVALVHSRHRVDIAWALMAGLGIVALAPVPGTVIDGTGVLFGLLAGAFWAGYIVLNVRVGRAFAGGSGLALAMVPAALLLSPFGLAAGSALLSTRTLVVGALVGLLSSAIPFSLEMEALRRVPERVYALLMSLEPVIGAVVGFVFLSQAISLRAGIAMILVTVASAGSATAHARETFQGNGAEGTDR